MMTANCHSNGMEDMFGVNDNVSVSVSGHLYGVYIDPPPTTHPSYIFRRACSLRFRNQKVKSCRKRKQLVDWYLTVNCEDHFMAKHTSSELEWNFISLFPLHVTLCFKGIWGGKNEVEWSAKAESRKVETLTLSFQNYDCSDLFHARKGRSFDRCTSSAGGI